MKKIGIIGMGAIGVAYLSILNEAKDVIVYTIADGTRKEKLSKGIIGNGKHYDIRFADENTVLDLIVVCVKYPQLLKAMEDIKRYVSKDTLILSSLNGIDSEEVISTMYPINQIVGGVVHMSSYFDSNGDYEFDADKGHLYIGKISKENDYDLEWVKKAFSQGGFTCTITEEIYRRKWYKFMANYSENIALALTGYPYGAFNTNCNVDAIRKLLLDECYSVIEKLNVGITREDYLAIDKDAYILPEDGKPSTLQDLEAKKKTEIEMFTLKLDEVARRKGVNAPYAMMVYHIIRAFEKKYE